MPMPLTRPAIIIALLGFLKLSMLGTTLHAQEVTPPLLVEVQRLADAGAISLALATLDRTQPAVEQDTQQWLVWEQARFHLYAKRQDWQALLARAQAVVLPVDMALPWWWYEAQAEAHLALRQGRAALAPLRVLLWQTKASRSHQQHWRRVVIEAHLLSGQINDAVRALRRYQQDYGQDPAERLLQARVWLRAGRASEAQQELAGLSSEQARPWYLLARLRNGGDPKAVFNDSRRALQTIKHKDIRRQLWSVRARAAQQQGDWPSALYAMRNALILTPTENEPQDSGDPFRLRGADLWQGYLLYGESLANREHLLLGADGAWLVQADKLRKGNSEGARALYAVLALRSPNPDSRQQGHSGLVESLSNHKPGSRLWHHLYRLSPGFTSLDDLPAELRYQMVDAAIKDQRLDLASELIGGLNAPPAKVDTLFWKMRRARIMLLGGQTEQGLAAVRELILQHREMQADDVDRLIQVLFDVQRLGRHREAIELFQALPVPVSDYRRRREALYWIADSYKAIKDYTQAARYYLRSAMLGPDNGYDDWGQTARYQAAESLSEAGLREDAQALYEQLLLRTTDPQRRAVLKGRLEQLWHYSQGEAS